MANCKLSFPPRLLDHYTFYQSNGAGHRENVTLTHATDSFNVTYRGSAAQSDNYKAGGDFKSSTYAQNLNSWQTNAINNGSSVSPYATGWMNSKTLGLNEVGSSAYKSYNQELGFAFKLNRDVLELRYGYQHIPYELYPNQRMDMLDNEQKRINLKYLADFNWGTLEARAYNETTNHFMDFGADKQYWYGYNAAYTYNPATNSFYLTADPSKRAFVATGMPMYTQGNTMGTSLKADIKLKDKETLRLGTDIQQYKLDDWWPASPSNDGSPYYNATGALVTMGGMYPNTFQNINNGRRDRLGVYAELETQRSQAWKTLFGARIEKVDTSAANVQGYNNATTMMNYGGDAAAFNAKDHNKSDINLDLSALARYAPDNMKSYDFGLARKVRSPNLYERYTWANSSMAMIMNNWVGDGNGYVGNTDLKPEVAHTASVTASYHDAEKTWEVNVTPHYSLVDNYIDAIRRPNSTGANKFVQLQFANQSAQIYGLDVSGRMPLAKNDLGNWGLKGIISYVRGTNLDTNDDLYNIMPLNAKFTLTHQLAKWSNAFELLMVADKSDVSDVRNEIKTAGYNIMNLRSSYAYNKQVRVDFGVENIADTLYYMPLGGAYSGQGTTMNINGIPYGVGIAGMGRSIYTGITYKF
jgi:iron complex outermembrane receptor protein